METLLAKAGSLLKYVVGLVAVSAVFASGAAIVQELFFAPPVPPAAEESAAELPASSAGSQRRTASLAPATPRPSRPGSAPTAYSQREESRTEASQDVTPELVVPSGGTGNAVSGVKQAFSNAFSSLRSAIAEVEPEADTGEKSSTSTKNEIGGAGGSTATATNTSVNADSTLLWDSGVWDQATWGP